MDFLDYMICIFLACSIEALLVAPYYTFYARKIYRIVDNYRMAPDNDIVAAEYKKLTNSTFNPVITVVRFACYSFGFAMLLAFTVCVYQYLGL